MSEAQNPKLLLSSGPLVIVLKFSVIRVWVLQLDFGSTGDQTHILQRVEQTLFCKPYG